MYLEGQNIKPRTAKEARALIGTEVIYLQSADIDKSGRGYYFPRRGVIAAVVGRNIAVDHPENFVIYMSNLVEMVKA